MYSVNSLRWWRLFHVVVVCSPGRSGRHPKLYQWLPDCHRSSRTSCKLTDYYQGRSGLRWAREHFNIKMLLPQYRKPLEEINGISVNSKMVYLYWNWRRAIEIYSNLVIAWRNLFLNSKCSFVSHRSPMKAWSVMSVMCSGPLFTKR